MMSVSSSVLFYKLLKKGGVMWRCAAKNCTVRVKTTDSDIFIAKFGSHEHSPQAKFLHHSESISTDVVAETSTNLQRWTTELNLDAASSTEPSSPTSKTRPSKRRREATKPRSPSRATPAKRQRPSPRVLWLEPCQSTTVDALINSIDVSDTVSDEVQSSDTVQPNDEVHSSDTVQYNDEVHSSDAEPGTQLRMIVTQKGGHGVLLDNCRFLWTKHEVAEGKLYRCRATKNCPARCVADDNYILINQRGAHNHDMPSLCTYSDVTVPIPDTIVSTVSTPPDSPLSPPDDAASPDSPKFDVQTYTTIHNTVGLRVNDFRYVVKSRNEEEELITWRCYQRKCIAKCTTTFDYQLIYDLCNTNFVHNHR